MRLRCVIAFAIVSYLSVSLLFTLNGPADQSHWTSLELAQHLPVLQHCPRISMVRWWEIVEWWWWEIVVRWWEIVEWWNGMGRRGWVVGHMPSRARMIGVHEHKSLLSSLHAFYTNENYST